MKSRLYPASFGFLVLAVYTWFAFRCVGYDWAVSEMFGNVITIAQNSGFPYFSYFYNGGVYLAHDPQAWVTSPTFNLLVRATGAIAAARWLGVFYAVVGYFSTYAWLRTRFNREISVFGALALTLSLGMFWRVVAGHMLFLLQMILPFLLLAIFRIEKSTNPVQRLAWVSALAIVGAWTVYEPGFHALFYFVIPVLLIEFAARLYFATRATLRLLIPLGASAMLALTLILPKLIAWKSFSMSRLPDPTDGTLALKDVLGALFITARSTVMGFRVPGSNPERWHFIFEVNSALMPIASLLALVGIFFAIKRKWLKEKNLLVAGVCLLSGIVLASNQTVWESVRSLTSDGIRVPSRFIPISAFGLMIFSVYGLEGIGGRFPKYARLITTVSTVLLVALSVNWLYRAQKSETLQKDPLNWGMNVRENREFALGKYCPVGGGCLNTYQAGYDSDPYIRYLSANKITETNFRSILPPNVTVASTSLTLTALKPGEVLDLPFRFASLGHQLESQPSGLNPRLESFEGHIRIFGDPTREVKSLEIRPLSPFPLWSLWVAGLASVFASLAAVGGFLLSALQHTKTTSHPVG